MLERVVHAIAPAHYFKNRIITLLKRFIDSKLIAKYSQVIFIRLNQLNRPRHGKAKILLDVSKTSSRLNANTVVDPSN